MRNPFYTSGRHTRRAVSRRLRDIARAELRDRAIGDSMELLARHAPMSPR